MFSLFCKENAPLKTKKALEAQVVSAIKTVFDPEIPVNIYDLGLIYNISIDNESRVTIDMTLTAPACPVAGILPNQVKTVIESLDGVKAAEVELVWEPRWSKERMSDEAKLSLGLM